VDVLSTQQVHVMRHNTQHTTEEGDWMTNLAETSQGAKVASAICIAAVAAGKAGGSAAGSAFAAESVAGMGRQCDIVAAAVVERGTAGQTVEAQTDGTGW
jgi:hypothetical protein